jgi:hypothetical protein
MRSRFWRFLFGCVKQGVDFRSRRFAFRGGRIMKKLKCQLFHNSSLLAVSPQESTRLERRSTGLKINNNC